MQIPSRGAEVGDVSHGKGGRGRGHQQGSQVLGVGGEVLGEGGLGHMVSAVASGSLDVREGQIK